MSDLIAEAIHYKSVVEKCIEDYTPSNDEVNAHLAAAADSLVKFESVYFELMTPEQRAEVSYPILGSVPRYKLMQQYYMSAVDSPEQHRRLWVAETEFYARAFAPRD